MCFNDEKDLSHSQVALAASCYYRIWQVSSGAQVLPVGEP